jgi:hypothetical protein
LQRAASITHGHSIGHGAGRPVSAEYQSWSSAKHRCFSASDPHYADYGARGITMDPAWRESFARFFADMGPRPAGTTLDRINNSGDYMPGNCRWATATQQQNNKRSNITVTYRGQVVTLRQVARYEGIRYLRLYKFVRVKGMNLDAALRRSRALDRRRDARHAATAG